MPRIDFTLGVAIRGPIDPGKYQVDNKSIAVSYPETLNIGVAIANLPASLSTRFVVSWEDKKGRFVRHLRSSAFDRVIAVQVPLAAINELLIAYKLVRVGHLDGLGIRAVGVADTLYYYCHVDGVQTSDLNVGLKDYGGNNAWRRSTSASDPFNTGELARPHIGTNTMPEARRLVRCFELHEHGFYSEAFLVAFAVLDDVVQAALHDQLKRRGLDDETHRDSLLRGIKEHRLKLYLGPLLKVACGRSLDELWPHAQKALEWLNSKRNEIAHAGAMADHASAARAVYVCMKVIISLRDAGLVAIELPVHLFRHAKVSAAWTLDAPEWVPAVEVAERMDFST